MAIRMVKRDILELALDCGLQDYPFCAGSDRRVCEGDIAAALAEGRMIAPEDARDPNTPMTAEEHAARIAWLVRNLDLKRVAITVKAGAIVDGNHRFAACLYSGIETVTCVMQELANQPVQAFSQAA